MGTEYTRSLGTGNLSKFEFREDWVLGKVSRSKFPKAVRIIENILDYAHFDL